MGRRGQPQRLDREASPCRANDIGPGRAQEGHHSEEAEVEARLPSRFYRGKGCSADNLTGYSGRIGIFELFYLSEEIRQLIIDPSFSLDGLRSLARKEGMVGMFEDGLRKVGRGITTIDEVFRVIQE